MLQERLRERYHLLEELGHGGMAVVYRARDEVLERDVAVKVLHTHLADRPDARRRLRREALAVAKLSHDHILKVFDFSAEDETGPAFLVTEYVRGKTLRALLDKHKDLPAEAAAMIGVVLAEALSHAHKSGIIHRDIKPENVMFQVEDGALKLMDFGIAKVFEEKEITMTGGLLGSPAHMAPEVIEGKTADARSDIFSLGTVLYLFATGEYPFWAQNPHALLRQIAQGKFKDPEALRPGVGRRLAGIIKKTMALDPAARYPDVTALSQELRAFLAEVGIEEPYGALKVLLKDIDGESSRIRARTVEALLLRARAALRKGRTGEVLAHLNRILAYDPENAQAAEIQRALSRKATGLYLGLGLAGLAALGAAAGYYFLKEPPAFIPLRAYANLPVSFPVLPVSGPATGPVSAPVASAPVIVPASTPAIPSSSPAVATSLPVGKGRPEPKTIPAKPEEPAKPVSVFARTNLWMNVLVDGVYVGQTPSLELSLLPGRHTVDMVNPGCKPQKYKVEVSARWDEPIKVNGAAAREIGGPCEWLPAMLTVTSNPPDVEIKIYKKDGAGDTFQGKIRLGVKKIPIEMSDSRMEMILSFVPEGYAIQDLSVSLVAGESKSVSLNLVSPQ
jgi:eukaryotic-like serine/threonine-protein kinase